MSTDYKTEKEIPTKIVRTYEGIATTYQLYKIIPSKELNDKNYHEITNKFKKKIHGHVLGPVFMNIRIASKNNMRFVAIYNPI